MSDRTGRLPSVYDRLTEHATAAAEHFQCVTQPGPGDISADQYDLAAGADELEQALALIRWLQEQGHAQTMVDWLNTNPGFEAVVDSPPPPVDLTGPHVERPNLKGRRQ